MNRYRKWLRTEMDVEFFSCVHGVSMIFIYGLLLWFSGHPNVSFAIIFEMMVLGYAMAWTQKALFLKEKLFSRREYMLRQILWSLLPIIYMPIVGTLFHWFTDIALWVMICFYLIMACYFVMVWVFIQLFYQEDTSDLNHMLTNWKKTSGTDTDQ